jgi:2-desacetyl-2-hydroxyethyl bacteriochlorophyllide A dehydrogenase
LGSDVTDLKVSDRVVSRTGHASHTISSSSYLYPVPDGISDENAVWFGLAKIAWFGANAAQYRLGDSVLIIGAGPIGQMSIRWARVAGAASIIVVDSFPERIPFAQAGGATATIVASIGEAREAILAANQNKPPRVVMDSTGNAAVFASALSLVRSHGTVVVLGDTGTPAKQHLTGDVVLRGIHIVGAHDSHDTEEWNMRTLTKLVFDLALSGRFSLDGLTTHSFTPSQCEEAYAQANRDRAKTMGIVFDWANQEVK